MRSATPINIVRSPAKTANDYRSEGRFAQWLRQTIAKSPNLSIEQLVTKAELAPRSWRMRQRASAAMVRAAVNRLILSGEIEILKGRVGPTGRIRVV